MRQTPKASLNTCLVLTTSLLFAQQGGAPESQTTTSTEYSRRLVIQPKSMKPPAKAHQEGISGALEVRLLVKPTGEVAKLDKISGSDQVLFHFQKFLNGLKFEAKDKSDIGPWEVTIVLTTNSNGDFGRTGSGFAGQSSSASSFTTKIKKVDSIELKAN